MSETTRRNIICPRVIRLRDAAFYLGMDKNRFNAEVRPYVTEIRIGTRSVGFDRQDLDAWFEQYKALNGRPGKAMDGGLQRERRSRQGSSNAARLSQDERSRQKREFEDAVKRAIERGRKRK